MSIKIHIIDKDDLSYLDEIDLIAAGLLETSGMTISHLASNVKSTEATINFEIDIVKENVPVINDVDFCLSIRKKVNMTAIGVNGEIIEDVGEDLGRGGYEDVKPVIPPDLPPGFKELYKG